MKSRPVSEQETIEFICGQSENSPKVMIAGAVASSETRLGA